MLIKIGDEFVVNTTQIVSITKSNMASRPSCITMSDGSAWFHDLEPLELADRIVKAKAAADTYYLMGGV